MSLFNQFRFSDGPVIIPPQHVHHIVIQCGKKWDATSTQCNQFPHLRTRSASRLKHHHIPVRVAFELVVVRLNACETMRRIALFSFVPRCGGHVRGLDQAAQGALVREGRTQLHHDRDVRDALASAGALLIIGSGVYIIHREAIRAAEKASLDSPRQ